MADKDLGAAPELSTKNPVAIEGIRHGPKSKNARKQAAARRPRKARKRAGREPKPKGQRGHRPPVTQAQYARLIGVSPSYVHRLVKSGRIPRRPDGLLNIEACDRARLKGRDVSRDQASGMAEGNGDEPTQEALELANKYQKARTDRMEYAARMQQLEYDRARELLIDKQEALAAFYALSRAARNSFQQLQARLPGLVVGKRKKELIAEIIKTEVDQVLERLADKELLEVLD